MKKRILSCLLTGVMLCICATGCGMVKADYVAEMPDGSRIEISQEEAEGIKEVQEELGIDEEDIEQINEIMETEENGENEEVEETEEETVITPNEVLGANVGYEEILGVSYAIYEKGAVLAQFEDEYGELQEKIEYDGKEYPVIAIFGIGREEFVIPDYIKYVFSNYDMSTKGYSELKSLAVPETVKYFYGYFGKSNIESLTLPETIQTLESWERTFEESANLKALDIPKGVKVLDSTFSGCTSLESVVLPEGLKEIGNGTFARCESLKEITIPTSVTKIGAAAFSSSGIHSLTIPEGVMYFDVGAVEYCNELEELIIPNTVTEGSTNVRNCENLKTIVFSNNAEFQDISSNNGRFRLGYLPKLELVVFPDNVQEITRDEGFISSLTVPCTFQVPENTVSYFQNKFPEINVVAK